jgi:hypothetical protein
MDPFIPGLRLLAKKHGLAVLASVRGFLEYKKKSATRRIFVLIV